MEQSKNLQSILQKFTTANESIPWHIETDIILKYNLSLICKFLYPKKCSVVLDVGSIFTKN